MKTQLNSMMYLINHIELKHKTARDKLSPASPVSAVMTIVLSSHDYSSNLVLV